MTAYTPPAKKPTWSLSKKDILTLLLFLVLFACAITVSQMRGIQQQAPARPENTKVIVIKEQLINEQLLKELSIEGLFGQEHLKAKAYYACPKAGCSTLFPVDWLLDAQNLALSYEGFMALHLDRILIPVAVQNSDKSVKSIALTRLHDQDFLNKVISMGFVKAVREQGSAYVITTDPLIEFSKIDAVEEQIESMKK
jgi:hypothetical protein